MTPSTTLPPKLWFQGNEKSNWRNCGSLLLEKGVQGKKTILDTTDWYLCLVVLCSKRISTGRNYLTFHCRNLICRDGKSLFLCLGNRLWKLRALNFFKSIFMVFCDFSLNFIHFSFFQTVTSCFLLLNKFGALSVCVEWTSPTKPVE